MFFSLFMKNYKRVYDVIKPMHIYLFESLSDHEMLGQVFYCLQKGAFSYFFCYHVDLRVKASTCLILLMLHEKIHNFARLIML